MARQECDYLDNVDLTQERFIGVFNGSPLYEKWYTGTVSVTGTTQVLMVDSDTSKVFRDITGTINLAGGTSFTFAPFAEPQARWRFSCMEYSNGLQLVYGIVDTGAHGTATYNIHTYYTK